METVGVVSNAMESYLPFVLALAGAIGLILASRERSKVAVHVALVYLGFASAALVVVELLTGQYYWVSDYIGEGWPYPGIIPLLTAFWYRHLGIAMLMALLVTQVGGRHFRTLAGVLAVALPPLAELPVHAHFWSYFLLNPSARYLPPAAGQRAVLVFSVFVPIALGGVAVALFMKLLADRTDSSKQHDEPL